MLLGTCLRMLATLPPYQACLQPRTKFWLVFAAICFSFKKIIFTPILGWPAMGRELHAVGYMSAHARHAAGLRGAPPAAHQVLARLRRHLLFLKKIIFTPILGWTAMGRELHAVGYVSAHARHAAGLRGAPPAAHQVLARLRRHLLFLKKKSFSRQF